MKLDNTKDILHARTLLAGCHQQLNKSTSAVSIVLADTAQYAFDTGDLDAAKTFFQMALEA
jgi:hypothetical protein